MGALQQFVSVLTFVSFVYFVVHGLTKLIVEVRKRSAIKALWRSSPRNTGRECRHFRSDLTVTSFRSGAGDFNSTTISVTLSSPSNVANIGPLLCELLADEFGRRVPLASRSGEIDRHAFYRARRLHTRLTLKLRVQRNLCTRALGKLRFNSRSQQVIDELLRVRKMRSVLQDAQSIGDEQRPELIRLAIGIHDRDRTSFFDFDDRVVGVGETERGLPRRNRQGHLFVARKDLYVVRFQFQEKRSSLFVTELSEQTGAVGRRRSE